MSNQIRINLSLFARELELASALAGYRGACEDGQIFFLDSATPEQISAIEAVFAAHDPSVVDLRAAVLAELSALESAPILLSRALEDIFDGLPSEVAAEVPAITRERIARKKALRAILAQ